MHSYIVVGRDYSFQNRTMKSKILKQISSRQNYSHKIYSLFVLLWYEHTASSIFPNTEHNKDSSFQTSIWNGPYSKFSKNSIQSLLLSVRPGVYNTFSNFQTL